MTTWYVRKTGSNTNNGTSAATAYQTIGKALTSVLAGDTVYIGAGVYRETDTLSTTGSTGNVITLIGDVDGSQTGDEGEVRWSAYTTNDTSAASASALLGLAGKSYYTFQKITFSAGSNYIVDGFTTVNSTNITFQDCLFETGYASGPTVACGFSGTTNPTWTIDRCRFVGNCGNGTTGYFIYVDATAAGTEASNSFVIKNCMFVGSAASAIAFNAAGGYGNAGGGGTVQNCTSVGPNTFVTAASVWPTSYPVLSYNNVIVANIAYSGSSNITNNYDLVFANTGYSGVTGGTNSKSNYSGLFQIGQELPIGGQIRHFMTPTIDSPALGFGNNATYTSTYDLLNRHKPSGPGVTWSTANNAVGCLERHEFGVKDTTIYQTSPNSIKLTGPGDQMILIPVNANSCSISVSVNWSTGYAGTLPQLSLLANGEIGVAAQTVTATGSSGTWNTISLSNFTPTATGWVQILLVSNDTSGTATANFDTLSVTN